MLWWSEKIPVGRTQSQRKSFSCCTTDSVFLHVNVFFFFFFFFFWNVSNNQIEITSPYSFLSWITAPFPIFSRQVFLFNSFFIFMMKKKKRRKEPGHIWFNTTSSYTSTVNMIGNKRCILPCWFFTNFVLQFAYNWIFYVIYDLESIVRCKRWVRGKYRRGG